MSKRKIYGLNKDGKKNKKLNGFQRKQQIEAIRKNNSKNNSFLKNPFKKKSKK